jgi:hypothetical protein
MSTSIARNPIKASALPAPGCPENIRIGLNRESFLTAVLGHSATQRLAHGIADTRLAADAGRDQQ